MHTRADIFTVRLLRVAVAALALTVPLSSSVLDRLGDAQHILASIVLWALWAILLLSILIPASSALTALRLASPAHLATLVLVTSTAGIDAGTTVSLASSAIVSALAASAETGAYFIQSSAYGDERRFPLRCPRPFLVVIVIAWTLWFATAAAGAILLCEGIFAGALLAIVGIAGFVFLPRRFHRYARRWLVEVPAGLVVHDHVILTETAMFPRRIVTGVDMWSRSQHPDEEPFDLTGGVRAPGITITLAGPETVILAPTRAHPGGRAFHVRSARVSPSRIRRTLTMLNRRS